MGKEFMLTFAIGVFLLLDYFKGWAFSPLVCGFTYLLPSLYHILPVIGAGLLAFSAYLFISWYFFPG